MRIQAGWNFRKGQVNREFRLRNPNRRRTRFSVRTAEQAHLQPFRLGGSLPIVNDLLIIGYSIEMALRWTAAGMMEAAKGFRRLKAYRQLPILRTALVAHASKHVVTKKVEPQADAA